MTLLEDPCLIDVRIRPYGRADADRLRRMTASHRSFYSRFFSGTPHIPERYVRWLDKVDHWDHEVLIGLLDDEIVGIAEYVRHGTGRQAELAVLVTDAWQGSGLAGWLIDCLSQLAARRGVAEFTADVLPGNGRALGAIRRIWPGSTYVRQDGLARFTLPLRAIAPPPRPRPPRELVTIA